MDDLFFLIDGVGLIGSTLQKPFNLLNYRRVNISVSPLYVIAILLLEV